MLIRFTAENFLSFDKETEFNMLTGDVRRYPDHIHAYPKIDLLKSAVIYGANGAGKSNLVQAIGALKEMVAVGTIHSNAENTVFRLSNNQNKPSTLELEFITKNVGYAYGVTFSVDQIQEEWLYKLNYGKTEDELIFERTAKEDGGIHISIANKYIKNQKDKMLIQIYEEDLLEHHMLFISLLKDKSTKFTDIGQAYKWLRDEIIIILPGEPYADLAYDFVQDDNFKSFTNAIIGHFDTGILELEMQTLDFDQYFGEDNITEKERVLKIVRTGETERVGERKSAIALMEDGKPVIKKVVSYHQKPSGEKVKFELFEESDGTLRLIDFVPIIYLLENFPITIIIDEIDQSIHPALLKEFVAKIQTKSTMKGQLIFTTHESNLLDLDLFRQDEIWFAEKNKEGASHFYPLSEYNVRPDLDIRKGYLSGRFGAIPFLADLKNLTWSKHVEK